MPGIADAESQIRILAIGRHIGLVEPAERMPKVGRNGDGGTRNIVHLTGIGILRPVGIIVAAIVPSRAILPDNAARLLQRPIGIEQLGPDKARLGEQAKAADQLVQPTSDNPNIIVEHDHIMAARALGDFVAVADKALVLAVPHMGHVEQVGQVQAAVVGRTIIPD